MKFSHADKERVVRLARNLVVEAIGESNTQAACLYYAWAACVVGKSMGARFLLQAGSAYWPCVTPEHDDGVGPNAFGYEYEGEPSESAVAAGLMPEMHVWACYPEAAELIDLSTGRWPEQAKTLQGVTWRAPRPPDYLWCVPSVLPAGVVYRPKLEAARLAGRLLQVSFGRQDGNKCPGILSGFGS